MGPFRPGRRQRFAGERSRPGHPTLAATPVPCFDIPAPLPHLLNLVVFFTVDATMLKHQRYSVRGSSLFRGGEFVQTAGRTSPAQVKGKTNKAGGIDPGYSWTYLDASGSSPFPDLAVYQTGLTVPAPYVAQAPASGATRIDLRSMWVAASQEDGTRTGGPRSNRERRTPSIWHRR